MPTVARSTNVSLAQRYWNFEWDHRQNVAAYGALASPDGVGANLRVQIKSVHERDLQPGLVLIKRWLDHRELFTVEPDFRDRPSTLEAITHWTRERLASDPGGLTEVNICDGEAWRCRARFSERNLEVSERVANLTFTRDVSFSSVTGLGATRGDVERAVQRLAPRFAHARGEDRNDWGRRLFAEFKTQLPTLREIYVSHGADDVQCVRAPEPAPKVVDFTTDLVQLET